MPFLFFIWFIPTIIVYILPVFFAYYMLRHHKKEYDGNDITIRDLVKKSESLYSKGIVIFFLVIGTIPFVAISELLLGTILIIHYYFTHVLKIIHKIGNIKIG